MNREILEEPFPDSLIKSRRGAFGRSLSYVEGQEYIKKLNAAFDGEWSFEIVEHNIHGNEVVVLGKLTVGDVVKMAFGGSAITTNRESGEVVSIGDDMKAASTDAIKKACSLLGVGLHMYGEAGGDARADKPAARKPGNGSNGGSNGHRNTSPQDRLTSKQLNAVWSLSRSLGLSAEATRQRAMDEFGAVPEQLTRREASTLIGELMEVMNRPAEVAS